MEDRKIKESESLGIITEMIKNARTNLRARINCNILLIWGYTTFIVSLLVWGLKLTDAFSLSSLVWLIVPLTCVPASIWLRSKDTTGITSYIDQSIHYITILFALVCTTIAFSTLVVDFPVMFIELLLVSMLIVIVGTLIQFKPVIWGGLFGIIAAHLLLFTPDPLIQLPVFALTILFSMIIPGHLFKKSISADV